MKKIFALLLVLTLGLALVACGNSAEGQVTAFHPETPEEFIETVLEDFNSRTEYRRRSETYPTQPEKGEILDLSFSDIGSEEQVLSGTLKAKSTGTTNALYGEGDTVAKGPYLAANNVVYYAVMDSAEQVSPFLPTENIGLCVARSQLEKNLLSEEMTEHLSEAALTANEDGSYTLTVPLTAGEIFKLGGFSSKIDAIDFRRPSEIVYTANQQGALTSMVYFQTWAEKETFLRTEFFYEPATHKKPNWFNKEAPSETEEKKAVVSYVLDYDVQITLTPGGKGVQASVYSPYAEYRAVTVPDYIPTDVQYTGCKGNVFLIFEKWDPEMNINANGFRDGAIFFKKGSRPTEGEFENMYFEEEWEMKDGLPSIKKKR